jgi:hypothetical protein
MARLTPLILCSAVWACDAFNPGHVALRPRAYRLRAEQRADNADAVAAPDAIAAVELADAPGPRGAADAAVLAASSDDRSSTEDRDTLAFRFASVALVAAVLALKVYVADGHNPTIFGQHFLSDSMVLQMRGKKICAPRD